MGVAQECGSLLVKDRRLLRAFRRGEARALEQVYRAYAPHVARYIACSFAAQARRTRSAGAQDLEATHQETFLRAFSPRVRHAYDGRRPYEAYLNVMARSVAMDALRSARRRARVSASLEVEGELGGSLVEPLTPEQSALQAERRALVRRFLELQAPGDRHLAELRFVEGLSQERVAAALGLSRQEVRTREARLRRALCHFLAAEGWLDASR